MNECAGKLSSQDIIYRNRALDAHMKATFAKSIKKMFSLNQISPFLPSLLRSHTVFPSHDFSHSHSTAMFVFSSLLFPVDIFSLEIAVRIPLNFFIRRSTPLCKLDYAARSAEVVSGEGLLPNLFRERSCAHPPDKEGVKNRLHTFAFATSFHRQELSNLSVGELSRIAAFAQFLQL